MENTQQNKMKTKWAETGINVCDQTEISRRETGFTCRKAKWKPLLTPTQNKTRLQWTQIKLKWIADDWLKVI